jgi:hypothetical protein
MNFDQRLDQVANKYRGQGYEVIVRPKSDDLPSFAKDFKIDMIAKRNDGCVLVSAKKSQSDLESDREISNYAEITGKEPGWRLDLVVLGSESPQMPSKKDATEPSEEDTRRALGEVERILQAGFTEQALIAAWAVLETAMRRRLRASGEDAGWGLSPRTMINELYSSGVLQSSVVRDLEGLFQLRTAIVHGFTSSGIQSGAVQFLVETARMLLDESRAAKKIA